MVRVMTTFCYTKASHNKVLWLVLQIRSESICYYPFELPTPRLSLLPPPPLSGQDCIKTPPASFSFPLLPHRSLRYPTLPGSLPPLLNPMIALHPFRDEIQKPYPGSKNCFINSEFEHLFTFLFVRLHFFYCVLIFVYIWGSFFNLETCML